MRHSSTAEPVPYCSFDIMISQPLHVSLCIYSLDDYVNISWKQGFPLLVTFNQLFSFRAGLNDVRVFQANSWEFENSNAVGTLLVWSLKSSLIPLECDMGVCLHFLMNVLHLYWAVHAHDVRACLCDTDFLFVVVVSEVELCNGEFYFLC